MKTKKVNGIDVKISEKGKGVTMQEFLLTSLEDDFAEHRKAVAMIDSLRDQAAQLRKKRIWSE